VCALLYTGYNSSSSLQGYLAHKKADTTRTLQSRALRGRTFWRRRKEGANETFFFEMQDRRPLFSEASLSLSLSLSLFLRSVCVSPCVRVCFSLSDTSLPLPPSLSVFLSLSLARSLSLSRAYRKFSRVRRAEKKSGKLYSELQSLFPFYSLCVSLWQRYLCVSLSLTTVSLSHTLSLARARSGRGESSLLTTYWSEST
jgi:hypothetical protein